MLINALPIMLIFLLTFTSFTHSQNNSLEPITAKNAKQVTQLAVWKDMTYLPKNITFNEDLTGFVTYSETDGLSLWSIGSDYTPILIHTTSAIVYSLSQQLVAYQVSKYDSSIHIWDLASGTERFSFANASHPTKLAWNNKGTQLAYVTNEDIIEVWDIFTHKRLIKHYLDGSSIEVLTFVASSGDLLMQTNMNSGISIETSSVENRNNNFFMFTPVQRFSNVIFSADMSTVFTTESFYPGGEHGFINLTHSWNPFYAGTFEGGNIGFLPNGLLYSSVAVGSSHRQETITLRDPATLKIKNTFVFGGEVETAAYRWSFSPNGKRLITVTWDFAEEGRTDGITERAYTFWDVDAQEIIATPDAIESIGEMTISPDSTILATDNGQDIALWDTQIGELVSTLSGHSTQITRLIFSSNGTLLLSLSNDGAIRAWGITN